MLDFQAMGLLSSPCIIIPMPRKLKLLEFDTAHQMFQYGTFFLARRKNSSTYPRTMYRSFFVYFLVFSLVIHETSYANKEDLSIIKVLVAFSTITLGLSIFGLAHYKTCEIQACQLNESLRCCSMYPPESENIADRCYPPPNNAFDKSCAQQPCQRGHWACFTQNATDFEIAYPPFSNVSRQHFDIPGGKDSFIASIFGCAVSIMWLLLGTTGFFVIRCHKGN